MRCCFWNLRSFFFCLFDLFCGYFLCWYILGMLFLLVLIVFCVVIVWYWWFCVFSRIEVLIVVRIEVRRMVIFVVLCLSLLGKLSFVMSSEIVNLMLVSMLMFIRLIYCSFLFN